MGDGDDSTCFVDTAVVRTDTVRTCWQMLSYARVVRMCARNSNGRALGRLCGRVTGEDVVMGPLLNRVVQDSPEVETYKEEQSQL